MFVIVPVFMVIIIIIGISTAVIKGAKQAASPVTTVYGTIIAKRTEVDGRSNGPTSTYYYATVETQDGNRKEYLIKAGIYGLIKEGDKGTIVLKGKRLLNIDLQHKPQDTNGVFCNFCGTYMKNDETKCPACGAAREKS